MNDPTFGEIEFSIDAWDGIVPYEHAPSNAAEFAVHIWADDAGPTTLQRRTFDGLKARYPTLWPSIARALLDCRPDLGSTDAVEAGLNPTVGCYIEGEGGADHANFELVYTLDLPDEGSRGYFVRIVGWEVIEAMAAE